MTTPMRWTNPSLPPMLHQGVILLYIRAVLGLLFNVRWVVLTIAMVAGGYGIANEKRWGYLLGVTAAIFPFVVYAYWILGGVDLWDFLRVYILTLIFDVALAAMLLHPTSREYQRIWFR